MFESAFSLFNKNSKPTKQYPTKAKKQIKTAPNTEDGTVDDIKESQKEGKASPFFNFVSFNIKKSCS